MKATGKFNPRGLDAHQLLLDCIRGQAVVQWDENYTRVEAYGALEKCLSPWDCQIRKLYVSERYRANGNGRGTIGSIVKRLMVVPGYTGFRYFAITSNHAVIEVLLNLNFRIANAHNRGVHNWPEEAGIADRLPRTARGYDSDYAEGRKRWLLIN